MNLRGRNHGGEGAWEKGITKKMTLQSRLSKAGQKVTVKGILENTIQFLELLE